MIFEHQKKVLMMYEEMTKMLTVVEKSATVAQALYTFGASKNASETKKMKAHIQVHNILKQKLIKGATKVSLL